MKMYGHSLFATREYGSKKGHELVTKTVLFLESIDHSEIFGGLLPGIVSDD